VTGSKKTISTDESSVVRFEARILGLVQGVGFRPFVARLARELGLAGSVVNDGTGVFVDVEGRPKCVEEFFTRLKTEAPPLARISSVEMTSAPLAGHTSFTVKKSISPALRFALVSPDVATCGDCLREMLTPSDRRHMYPFINCTNCGPRFTIVTDVPYDRIRTTMHEFAMCDACAAEYADDKDRRFHAEPIACPVCGPSVRLVNRSGTPVPGDPIARAAELLDEDAIIAVKGLGGYHLACNASSPLAVSTLRKRKCREEKPLAIMVRDLATAKNICRVTVEEQSLLTSVERPIVLMRKQDALSRAEVDGRSVSVAEVPVAEVLEAQAAGVVRIAEEVAPNNKYLGVMLPYASLHHLLLEGIPALVMTSGNLTDEPISYVDEEAQVRLGGIADYFLVHNREIFTRCDDSVVRVVRGKTQPIRRSRGYVPYPVPLPFSGPPVLAVGAELKNTFCLVKGNLAFPGHHIGDLKNLEAYEAFKNGIEHLKRLLFIRPEVIAHDMHPDYLSTRYALESGLPLKPVQHHHAHVASCMAENGLNSKVIGLSFDGTGYGPDNTVWGGEILVADYEGYSRAAHLAAVPLPGGEAAINEPWRMAVSYLHSAYGDALLSVRNPLLERIGKEKLKVILRMMERGVNSIPTSSLGRLFDAVAALVGLREFVSFEGQAAMELEMAASDEPGEEPYPYKIVEEARSHERKPGLVCAPAVGQPDGGALAVESDRAGTGGDDEPRARVLDVREMVVRIVDDLSAGVPVSRVSRKFHETLCRAIVELCTTLRAELSINDVCMSGGVFQNALFSTLLGDSLERERFDVHVHTKVPPNDGGLALGQAAIACHQGGDS
jgi:hydrogenase maturation protein HypF